MSTPADLIAKPAHQEVILRREIDAPVDRVFDAFTDPERIAQWWGPSPYKTTVERMEVRAGGRWRFVQELPDGTAQAFHGVYHDAVRPQWVVSTFEYEGDPGRVRMETTTFNDRGNKTLLVQRTVFQSPEDRDAMMEQGLEEGARESLERLARIVEAG